VFDYGEAEGTCYMVMEYIAGKDLSLHLAQAGRLSLAEALPVLIHLAEALDYAHSQGLVHRDVKPSNILLDTAGAGPGPASSEYRPVLTDFGITKILGSATRYTETGGVLGTFDYIAPEQIQGAADIDGRADIYSFGVMVYQALTGELPFQHHNPGALLMSHMLQPPPDPRDRVPGLSSEAAYAIQRAMAKKPDERFATAGEFVAALS
jgi:serine/threonine protein kinase